MLKLAYALGITICLGALPNMAIGQPTSTLEIKNFIGTIDVEAGDFDKISIVNGDGVKISQTQAGVLIDNGDQVQNRNCRWQNNQIAIGKAGWGRVTGKSTYKNIDEFPVVKIRVPHDTHLIIADALIFGTVGDIGSADVHVGSCGDLDLGNIRGMLALRISGSGDVTVGNGSRANLQVSGSGDVIAGDFEQVDIQLSGSGDIKMGHVKGRADVQSSGSSDLKMGRVGAGLHIKSSGSSDFTALYVGDTLSLNLSGSSDVRIADGNVNSVYISASGSADVVYNGNSEDAEIQASGASDIYIKQPSGNIRIVEKGSADIHVRP